MQRNLIHWIKKSLFTAKKGRFCPKMTRTRPEKGPGEASRGSTPAHMYTYIYSSAIALCINPLLTSGLLRILVQMRFREPKNVEYRAAEAGTVGVAQMARMSIVDLVP